MAWSLIVLIAIIGVVLAFFGSCQFSPGGPTVEPGPARIVDADQSLRRAASSTGFAVRSPAVPDGWRATSAGTGPLGSGVDAAVVVRASWVTAEGRYLRLAQSPAPAEVIVADEGNTARPVPEGAVEVGAMRWTVYPWQRAEKAWVATLDGVQVMVAGSGSDEEFRALAGAVQAAKPLPRS